MMALAEREQAGDSMLNAQLRHARKAAGLTQGDMARLLGYKSKAQYCMLERGQRRVTVDVALRISRILNKSVEELFNVSEVNAVQTQSDGPRAVSAG